MALSLVRSAVGVLVLRVTMSTGDLLRAASVSGAVVCQEQKEDLTSDILLCRLYQLTWLAS